MSLNFAGISPHPPIIVPGIGSDEDMAKVGETILGMKKLTTAFRKAEIDTLIIISPHMLIYPDKFNISVMQKLFGSFASFNHPEIIEEAQNDLDFVSILEKKMNEAQVNHVLYDNGGEFFELDHGSMVPLSYLKQNQDSTFKVVPITYSYLPIAAHFAFGQVLKEAMAEYSGRVGILASGDLSHQLLQNPEGKKFDKQLVDDLKEHKVQDILYYDEEFVEEAGECGYRSIVTLLGAIDGSDVKPEIFSYEGPFGVGYLVANYKLGEN